jgi:16S rRNA (uracil1498-N3)-methyltransferase
MQLFYLPEIPESTFRLENDESKHLVRVLRRKVGDLVDFTNGKGAMIIAELIDANQRSAELRLISIEQAKSPQYHLHLAIAPTKKMDRIEWCLEKSVEMGLQEFSLIHTERTFPHKIKMDRLERIALSAMKQSGQYFLPKLNAPCSLDDFLQKTDTVEARYIAHCEPEKKTEFSGLPLREDTLVLIGPEGDFSPEEIEKARKKGFEAVSLGDTRLRTETAGLFACASHRHKRINNEN